MTLARPRTVILTFWSANVMPAGASLRRMFAVGTVNSFVTRPLSVTVIFTVWLSARLRFWEGPGGVRAMATVALATSLALLFVDAGQPDVRLFRIDLAAWGIGGAAAALMQGREDFQQ